MLTDLTNKRMSGSRALAPQSSNCRYSVFGLGSSAYPNFCAFAKRVDDLLNKFGFKRLLELYTADEKKNQDLAFREWSLEAYSKTCAYFGTSGKKTLMEMDLIGKEVEGYSLCPSIDFSSVVKGLQHIHKKPISTCKAVSVESLVSPYASSDAVLVKFQHDQLLYSPGDHLAIFPTNSKDKVEKLCQSCIFEDGMDSYTQYRLLLLRMVN
ncbi:NOS3 [Bugula neritina]|uniref:nitric-oxide synthase (NADPH) n=1 Tax=Bugula neritina TaxID=10212 RepID=A0A7J7K543_BUGNE|nr:NOS3 [Bugula neritina]